MKIGIVILATNSYFVLGLRFMHKFMRYYQGKANVTFYFFSDEDPKNYVPFSNIIWIATQHNSWIEGTNSKFSSIVSACHIGSDDYIYYFDADTSINKPFIEDWFLGELVGGEHYCNRYEGRKPYDRNPRSKAYIPLDTSLPQTYYYGAFFGGKREKVLDFCRILIENQLEDKKIKYEPGVNDESYINQYFHYNPPMTVPVEKFAFIISDKGGIKDTRSMKTNINLIKNDIKKHKTSNWDIINGKFTRL